jgi:hypothetical protein
MCCSAECNGLRVVVIFQNFNLANIYQDKCHLEEMSLVPKSRRYFIICEDGLTDKKENSEALSNSGGRQKKFQNKYWG